MPAGSGASAGNAIYEAFGISEKVVSICREAEKEVSPRFAAIDEIAELNTLKVVKAMQDCQISEACMLETTGYGYNDIGRDRLEEVYAKIFKTEDALVRSQIVCGTHALALALFGNTRPGDEIFSPVGMPYDTLQSVIGINEARGSLKEYGVSFSYADLLPDGGFDFDGIRAGIKANTKLVEIQRSRGYSERRSFSVGEIGELIKFIRGVKPDVYIMVDNCYGEYTELIEPSEVGADIVVGSLIKNPGGGIAPVGGYIAGRTECIENCAARLTAPGLYKEVGPSLGNNRLLYQGTFLAPTVTAAAEKSAVLASAVFEKLGFKCSPASDEVRHDIIEALTLSDPAKVISFCKGIQKAAAVDHFAAPEPAPMPGYESDIIMAAGCFISGSSIELSADGPLREPYNVFFQGGLSYPHGKLGIMMGVQELVNDGLLKL
ncbi:MAG: methionine gamma-lyase family protein [Eubacteriales bacterium]|nr:methionine gamma-lyase family protein [Eubacteriales bacterium]